MRRYFIGVVIILIASVSNAAVVKTEAIEGDLDQYGAELLLKILNYGKDRYTLKSNSTPISHSRDIADLQNNIIDVLWTATSIQRERDMLPIRIPIYKGLIGYRIFVIEKEKSDLFKKIKTLSGLKDITIGQGQGWVDSDILRINGFKVAEALNLKALYTMLKRGRFDGLLRGIHQPWDESKRFNSASTIVDKNILIRYPLPMYFFVSKNNHKLARLIEGNFEKMINDGSFDLFFYNHSKIKNVIKRANVKNRKIFNLSNPFLPALTPLSKSKYWYSMSADE